MAMTAPETGPAPLVVTLFGPIQVTVDGQPLPRLRSRKSLWLLALITLRHGRPVEREWLAGTLWPDADQEQAFANLRVVLSELRKALGAQGARLQSPDRHTVSLDLAGADVDVAAFDAAIANGTPSALARAAALYTGPLLEGCHEEWAPQERRTREEDCLRALQTLGGAALAAGDPVTAAGYYRRAVVMDPWREAARRGLMEALSKAGDTNDALQAYREFTELLRSDPKAAPDEETSALYARLRAELRQRAAAPEPAAPGSSAPTISGYLPHALTDLVGRQDECLEVAAKLRRSRLVTLTGPGGIGKTRLAIEVAAEVAPEFTDGGWMVALEALETRADGAQVERQIASVLGVKEGPDQSLRAALIGHLCTRRVLLVLDNCEHVLAACSQVLGHLLRECRGVRVLATSREALGLSGETAWAVPALSVPDPAHLPVNRATLVRVLVGYEGVQLFLERAQAVQKTFALTGDNALALAQICSSLEGIPLAIELAAARIKVLTVAQIASRLDDHLGLLAGASRGASRQRTLRATLDWSYSLLGYPEKRLLERLSVFAGADLEAVEQVCSGGEIEVGEVVDLLAGLADKSLIIFGGGHGQGGDGAGRYRLLEVVRQYAAEKLAAGGEADTLRSRHRDWYLRVAETAPDVRGPSGERGRQVLEMEYDNLRLALAWCEGDPEAGLLALRLAVSQIPTLVFREHYTEGRHCVERALAHAGAQAATAERAGALMWAKSLSMRLSDYAAAREAAAELLALQRERGDKIGIGDGLLYLGDACGELGDLDGARDFYEEALAVFREWGDPSRVAIGLASLAWVLGRRGEYAAAQPLYEQSLELHRAANSKLYVGFTLVHLGITIQKQGDYGAAEPTLEEGLALLRDFGDASLTADALSGSSINAFHLGDYGRACELAHEYLLIVRRSENVACACDGLGVTAILLAEKAPEQAVRLLAAADALRDTIRRTLPLDEREATERLIDGARRTLGDERFGACWAAGRALNRERAVEYALEQVSLPLVAEG